MLVNVLSAMIPGFCIGIIAAIIVLALYGLMYLITGRFEGSTVYPLALGVFVGNFIIHTAMTVARIP